MPSKVTADAVVRDIRRRTRNQYSAEEMIQIVLPGRYPPAPPSFFCLSDGRQSKGRSARGSATARETPCNSIDITLAVCQSNSFD